MNAAAETLTFLLTDIEGSTRLWEQESAVMRRVLERHDAIAAETAERHGGSLVRPRGEGDSLFLVFGDPIGAVRAARDIQTAFLVEQWPLQSPFRVRMAIHTGDADYRDGDYYGSAVNRCARLRAAGHGGQILLSAKTRSLVSEALSGEVEWIDLGDHRLKDLQRPERVHQLAAPGLPRVFPPLRTLNMVRHNLPRQATTFIGREKELADVRSNLSSVRLLTLTGPAGIGKSRLSAQAAADLVEEFDDGVWWVELSSVTNPDQLPDAVSCVLGIADETAMGGVGSGSNTDRPATADTGGTAGGTPPEATDDDGSAHPPRERESIGSRPPCLLDHLVQRLRSRRILLILDHCEHLTVACSRLVEELLRSCSQLRILSTSRERLGAAGETAYPLHPLELPPDDPSSSPDLLHRRDASRLFIERALTAHPSFTVDSRNARDVARICRRLGGNPMAIELAAARVRAMSVGQIIRRLDGRGHSPPPGGRDAAPREDALEEWLDWTHEQLTPKQRVLLRRLTVFSDGCALDAVEQVCAGGDLVRDELPDLLTGLIDNALVLFDPNDEPERYHLPDSVIAYGSRKLYESGEAEEVRRSHRRHYLILATDLTKRLLGTASGEAFEQIALENANLRTALGACLDVGSARETGLRLASLLASAIKSGDLSPVRTIVDRGRTVAKGWRERIVAGGLFREVGGRLSRPMREPAASERFERAMSADPARVEEAERDCRLGFAAEEAGDSPAARACFERSLACFAANGHAVGAAFALDRLAVLAAEAGEGVRAAVVRGAIDSVLGEVGLQPRSVFPDYDRRIDSLRAGLGEPAYLSAWIKGRTMTLAQAVEFVSGADPVPDRSSRL